MIKNHKPYLKKSPPDLTSIPLGRVLHSHLLLLLECLIIQNCKPTYLGLRTRVSSRLIILLTPLLRYHNLKHVLNQFHLEFEVGFGRCR